MRALLIRALAIVVAIAPAAVSAQDLILTNANVVNVTDGSVARGVNVVVANGLITAVTSAPVDAPAGTRVIDLMGRWLAPGLMDAHVHVGNVTDARRALSYGVTTMRSMGASHYADVGIREMKRTSGLDVPELLGAGYHIRPTPAEEFFQDHPALMAQYPDGMQGEAQVATMVRAMVARGVDFIKTNATERAGLPNTDPRKQLYSEAELRAMVEAAGAIPVSAHAHGDAGGMAAVRAGVRSIEHGTYLSSTTLAAMKERGTYLVPTIAIVRDLTIPGGDYDNATLNIRGRHMLPRVQEMARTAHELGVRIVAATDTGYGPESTTTVAHELIEFVEIGMTPLQALQAATTTAAELFGIGDRAGRIAVGLQADLIVLERNPLDDIGVLMDVLLVVNDGVVSVQRGDWPGARSIS